MLPAIPPAPTFSRGFTLTEMAVVLVIVALLIGGMIMPMSAQQDIRYVNETQATLKNIEEALLGYAAVNGRLPRPATSATAGVENPTTSPTMRLVQVSFPGLRLALGKWMPGAS
jgi:prepilin-type N-terminal cleavage/methylation domain-containing protein